MLVAMGEERALRAVDGVAEDAPQLTIEQLAAQTGMSVRNIRNHQSRGLLPPPEVRNRVGYYGPEHVDRLRAIQELQADGLNLKAIERVLSMGDSVVDQMLGAKRAATAPFETEPPQIFSAAELLERFGEVRARDLHKAQKLGLLRPIGGDRFEVSSPRLLRAAEEVMEQGVTLAEALQVVEQLRRHCEGVARTFVKLYLDAVWKPFEDAGQPDDGWPRVIESIERLRPVAAQALLGVFEITMTHEVNEAFGKVIQSQANRLGKKG
jgi:DNA-binding transcriptional MerR regulator